MPKILAIDYGARHIGLALSDDEKGFAFPYNTINVKCQMSNVKCIEKIVEDINKICKLEDVERIVVGMPINLSGERTKTTEMVFNFVKELEKELDVPIDVEDERLTSVQAGKLQNKNAHNEHELSAQILLQSYLDRSN